MHRSDGSSAGTLADGAEGASAPATAADVCRGLCRFLYHQGTMAVPEVPLRNGRRADLMGVDASGCITIVEVKVSMADLRGDAKWTEYLDYCDRFFWAVPLGFARAELDQPRYLPERTGLLVADRYGAEECRAAPTVPLAAARRKTELIRFGRRAAVRLLGVYDPQLGQEG